MLKLIMEKVDHMAKPIKLFQERHGKYNKESNGNQRNEKFSDKTNTINGLISRLTQLRISEHEKRSIEIIHTEKQREKTINKQNRTS